MEFEYTNLLKKLISCIKCFCFLFGKSTENEHMHVLRTFRAVHQLTN